MIQIIFLLAQNTHLFINLSIDIDWDGLKEYYDRKKNKKKVILEHVHIIYFTLSIHI
jgi:hypothetical protein